MGVDAARYIRMTSNGMACAGQEDAGGSTLLCGAGSGTREPTMRDEGIVITTSQAAPVRGLMLR